MEWLDFMLEQKIKIEIKHKAATEEGSDVDMDWVRATLFVAVSVGNIGIAEVVGDIVVVHVLFAVGSNKAECGVVITCKHAATFAIVVASAAEGLAPSVSSVAAG